jgi:hypothetical protein
MIFAFRREIGKMSKKVQEFFKPKITRSEHQKSVGSIDSNSSKSSENIKIKEHEEKNIELNCFFP